MIAAGKHDPIRFNLLVLGESGLGKKSFLKSLFRKYATADQIFDLQSFAGTQSQEVNIAENGSFEIETETGTICFHLYQSQGFGNYVDNGFSFGIIREDLISRHDAWRNIDAQLLTEETRLGLDERIHCAMYFLSPHRIKLIDEVFMQQMADLVPIVPVVGKADSMTASELSGYLIEVEKLVAGLVTGDELPIYDFKEELQESASDELDSDNVNNSSRNQSQISSEGEWPRVSNGISADFNVSSDSMYVIGSSLSNSEVMEMPKSARSLVSTTATILTEALPSRDDHTLTAEENDGPQSLDSSSVTVTSLPRTALFKPVRNIFAIISSPSMIRTYPWGDVSVQDETLSDFRRLQKLLFEEGKHIRGMKRLTQAKTIKRYSNPITGEEGAQSITSVVDRICSFILAIPSAAATTLQNMAGMTTIWAMALAIGATDQWLRFHHCRKTDSCFFNGFYSEQHHHGWYSDACFPVEVINHFLLQALGLATIAYPFIKLPRVLISVYDRLFPQRELKNSFANQRTSTKDIGTGSHAAATGASAFTPSLQTNEAMRG